MVKMTVEEPKEVIVHHMYEVDVEELTKMSVTTFQGKPAFWCNGMLFLYGEISPMINPEIAKDYMNGKEHWHELYYATMKDYKKEFELSGSDFHGAKMRIIDASDFQFFRDVASWLNKIIKSNP